MPESQHTCSARNHHPRRRRLWFALGLVISLIGIIAFLSGYTLAGGVILLAGLLLDMLGLQFLQLQKSADISQQLRRVNTRLGEMSEQMRRQAAAQCTARDAEAATSKRCEVEPLHEILADDAAHRRAELQQERTAHTIRHIRF